MREVVIAGIGQTPVGELWDISLRSLAYQAIKAARLDAGGMQPQALYAGNFLSPVTSHQGNLSTLLADNAGLEGVEAFTVEAARSEEHTSELQSPKDLVCRLLLEKKK